MAKYQVTIGTLTAEVEASDEMEAIRLCRLQCPKDTGAAVVSELQESAESDEIPLPTPVVSEPINSVVESVEPVLSYLVELDPVDPTPVVSDPTPVVEPVVSNDDNNE